MLGFQGRNLGYGNHIALRDLTLQIAEGEKIAVIGPSGAGKSTLLQGLYAQIPARAALCPQELGLVDTLSVYHNIYMGQLDRHNALYNALNLIRPVPAHLHSIQQLASRLGLETLLRRPVATLSGGQRQRVALGRALYRQQPVFLGDEPVSNLDSHQGRKLLKIVLAQHDTAVVALHNRALALQLFERVIGIRNGVIALDGPPHSISTEQLQQLYAD